MNGETRTKRIYDPPEPADGARVLVDRVWPRGMTKEAATLTMWLKEIAPSTALRQWFGHAPQRWEEFLDRYFDEIDGNGEAVRCLRELSAKGPVTLLFAARDRERNNAVALADYLRGHRRRNRRAPADGDGGPAS